MQNTKSVIVLSLKTQNQLSYLTLLKCLIYCFYQKLSQNLDFSRLLAEFNHFLSIDVCSIQSFTSMSAVYNLLHRCLQYTIFYIDVCSIQSFTSMSAVYNLKYNLLGPWNFFRLHIFKWSKLREKITELLNLNNFTQGISSHVKTHNFIKFICTNKTTLLWLFTPFLNSIAYNIMYIQVTI